ncbi:MAG: DUF1887 family CARF protein [Lachnobacterium sp.]|nr:DUF1887 family CARF protein [Lachnobacterium sp.]MDY2910926.1 DUF1887 family CARF protein [Agathobacter sp.]
MIKNTVIEFYDEEPIANISACLRYKFERVIFVGFSEWNNTDEYKAVKHFLQKDEIGVKEVMYYELTPNSLANSTQKIKKIIENEIEQGRQCFFDITGGEEIALVAIGILMQQYDLPLHQINIASGGIDLLHRPDAYSALSRRNYQLSVEEYLNLHCAVIDYSKQKGEKKLSLDDDWRQEIYNLFEIVKKMGLCWNRFCKITQQMEDEDYDGCVNGQINDLLKKQGKLGVNQFEKLTRKSFIVLLKQLEKISWITNLAYDSNVVRFEYPSDRHRNVLTTEGACLEAYVGYRMMEDSDVTDCMVGVSLDWEQGGIQRQSLIEEDDVLNEIDVIAMRNNVPIFISCKNNIVKTNQPLYELDTVANRFGCEKGIRILAAPNGVTEAIRNRAEEMNIRINE